MARPIMINAAMEDVEMNILKEHLIDLKNVEDRVCTFYEGKLNDYPVVLCSSGEGLVNASVSTSVGINKYNPIAIIVQGVAGAHGFDIHKQDIVISSDVININSVKTSIRKLGEGVDTNKWEHLNFKHGRKELVPVKANERLIRVAQKVGKNYEKGNVILGRVGSGDIWNREVDRILMFHNKFGTLCEDMESFAVLQVAEKYDIPAISIRIISNNEVNNEAYDRNLGHDCQKFVIDLVNEYVRGIKSVFVKFTNKFSTHY